ncbi:uncharacterized protein FOMMEDRAFT_153084 [Fomitiporia mediterranea MF3/22]|uniref:uncharacterized protein n=1 Tax=Fomitiporia mediterranea (strain MF3/22) TaxID=694068 RepID=UPI0004408B91|nr:uncharacterized protein FOMMEDRAFT_153084 [Fomitiporia mediterranea MF3/22]EJD05746.1 hypothetical protein FOMMEDRAFT_153084 [Fomitiporia mediterranea MF3/22]
MSQGQGNAPYPSTAPVPYPPQPYGPHPADAYHSPYGQETPRELPQGPLPQPLPQQFQQQPQQQPPSPSRKSMFDFVSPFDALASTTSSSVKKKPVPDEGHELGEPWTSAPTDPKRKSMENLMDQLTRSSQGPSAPSQHRLDSYSPESVAVPSEPMQFQQKPLYAPKQQQHMPGSPRGSPPRSYAHQSQTQHRSRESPSGSMMQSLVGKARTESSPVRSNWKSNQESRLRAPKHKTFINSPIQSQNIVFDVSQNQESVQASRDYVKSTAIALVKVDPTFLPGTTIGATHWVAYAMTRGRVRVISRSSGDRTLLQLPSVFGPTISVTDMAVYNNRLAGVTSDGGFVVWELPEVITDDVPGKVLVCIVPHNEFEPLHSVKWHPKDPDTLAVASDSNINLLNVADAANVFRGQTFTQIDLPRVAQTYSVSSPLISFDFDIPHQALATISEDSVLTLWNIPDKLPFWSQKIPGEGTPSSLTFLDGGVVIGRKNGTVFQLLPVMGDVILSTVKFVNNGAEDSEMFGHVTYDSRIQTLWVANSKRDSLIALKVCFELSTPSPGGEELIRGGYFEQLIEFVGPKPTLNFVILTADADPTGDEANAACIAAKLPPGELALVAFSVHSSGVDQVLIRKEWYEAAFLSTTAKFPPFNPTMVPPPAPAQQPRVPQPPQVLSQPIPSVPIRLRTPPSEEIESEQNKEDIRPQDVKGKGPKGKNVGWKDREESNGGSSGRDKGKEKEKPSDNGILNESPLGNALSKEIRRVEENLHTRIGRLIAKELDKQQQRLEEARANEQAADFTRQEKILKLISTELTKNTTRVVETAVRGEVQNSVLPSLEDITRTEVKSAINTQLSKGVSESVRATMPIEIEKMFIKPEVSNQIARNLSSSLTPVIERHVKDVVTKTLLPAYQAQTSAMHSDLAREIHAEMSSLKKDVINWQSEAFRSHESTIRDMDQAIRSLSEQIKFMTMNMSSMSHSTSLPPHSSPSSSSSNYLPTGQSPMGQSHHRSANIPPMTSTSNYQPSFQQAPPSAPSGMHSQWYGPNLPGPPHGAQQVVQQLAAQPVGPPAPKTEEWDDTYLAVLSTQDLKQLRELLARSNPEIIMPSSGPGPLSQAVILTLVHRLAAAIGETSPVEEAFKSSLWWLQRASNTLNTNDPLISPYVGRVLPNVSQMLNTTKQRLGLLPGGPQLVDTTRLISDIQEILNRKPVL